MRPSTLSSCHSRASFVLAMVIVVWPCSIATAGPILLNFDVRMISTAASVDETDLGVAVTGGVEINLAGTTNVGGWFFDDEFVNVSSTASGTSLAYRIQGGLDPHPIALGYSTSWPADTTLQFSNFVLDQPGTLASVSVSVNGVVGAGGGALVSGTDFVFTATDLLLNIDSLGILEQSGQTPLGLMNFQLNFLADEPTSSVPDPASASTLFGLAIAALAAYRRLARRPQ